MISDVVGSEKAERAICAGQLFVVRWRRSAGGDMISAGEGVPKKEEPKCVTLS
jgi:hypothetical protein